MILKIFLIIYIFKFEVLFCDVFNIIVTLSNEMIKDNIYNPNLKDNGLRITFMSNYDCHFEELFLKIEYPKTYYPSQKIVLNSYYNFDEFGIKRKIYEQDLLNLKYYRNFNIYIRNKNVLLKHINFIYDWDFENIQNKFSNNIWLLGGYKNKSNDKSRIKQIINFNFDTFFMIGNNYQRFEKYNDIDIFFYQNYDLFIKKPSFILPNIENSLISYQTNLIRYKMPYNVKLDFTKIKGFEKNNYKSFDKYNFKNNFYSIYLNFTVIFFINNDLVLKDIINIEFLYNWIIKENNRYDEKTTHFKMVFINQPLFCSTDECFNNSFHFKPLIDLLYSLNFKLFISTIDGLFEISKNLNKNFEIVYNDENNSVKYLIAGSGGAEFKSKIYNLESIDYSDNKNIGAVELQSNNLFLNIRFLNFENKLLYKYIFMYNKIKRFSRSFYLYSLWIFIFITILILFLNYHFINKKYLKKKNYIKYN